MKRLQPKHLILMLMMDDIMSNSLMNIKTHRLKRRRQMQWINSYYLWEVVCDLTRQFRSAFTFGHPSIECNIISNITSINLILGLLLVLGIAFLKWLLAKSSWLDLLLLNGKTYNFCYITFNSNENVFYLDDHIIQKNKKTTFTFTFRPHNYVVNFQSLDLYRLSLIYNTSSSRSW